MSCYRNPVSAYFVLDVLHELLAAQVCIMDMTSCLPYQGGSVLLLFESLHTLKINNFP